MKLSRFQPALVTKTFPADLQDDVMEINHGNCMRWAYTAFHMFHDVELWMTLGHAFIRYRGKFYDSEKLAGEEDWKDLPANNFGVWRRRPIHALPASEKVFEAWWIRYNHIKPDWPLYRKLAAEAVKKHEQDSVRTSGRSCGSNVC